MDGKTLNHPLISLKSTKTNDVIYRICEKILKKNININCIHMKNINI